MSAYHNTIIHKSSFEQPSSIPDYSAYALISPTSRSKSQSYKLLSLLGSSHGLLSLYTRPFSNGVEAALVGVVLVLTRNILSVTYQWASRQAREMPSLCADGLLLLSSLKCQSSQKYSYVKDGPALQRY